MTLYNDNPLEIFEKFLSLKDYSTCNDLIIALYELINPSLEYSFSNTLQLIKKYSCNKKIKNISIVCAGIHYLRPAFNFANPDTFKNVMQCTTNDINDIFDQYNIFTLLNFENKSQPPCILKKSWCSYLEKMTASEIKNVDDKKLFINLIRICHPRAKINKNLQDVIYEESSRFKWCNNYIAQEMEELYKNTNSDKFLKSLSFDCSGKSCDKDFVYVDKNESKNNETMFSPKYKISRLLSPRKKSSWLFW